MDHTTTGHAIETHYEDKSLTELLRELSSDSSKLVRQESELFRREMEGRIDRVQRQLTMLGAGGIIALVGVLALTTSLILLLALAMPAWVAALLVGAAFVIGGALALLNGRKRLQTEELAPRQSIRSVKQDLRTMREAMR
jgi:uncharacterized membrane protein YqjE